MPETSPDSNQPTPVMTAQTPGTTQNSGDSIVALPLLSEQKGPISLTLTIDKSVGKVAAWVVGLVVALAMLVGAGIVMSVWMVIAYRETEREVRLQRLETDEMNIRLELAKIPKHQPGDKP
jgi:hypothetical protein